MKLNLIGFALFFTIVMATPKHVVNGQTMSLTENPEWNIDADWSMKAPITNGIITRDVVLDHDCTIDFPLNIEDSAVITDRITLATSEAINVLPGGELHIWGKVVLTYQSITLSPGGIIHVHEGGELIGMADVELAALAGEFIIDQGGSLQWLGNWNNNGGSGTTVIINGSVTIGGDMENKIDIVGDGSITVNGRLSSFPNSSIFGCSLIGV